MELEVGGGYQQRLEIGLLAEKVIGNYLERVGFHVLQLGRTIARGIDQDHTSELQFAWKSDTLKSSLTANMIRYTPDFLLIPRAAARASDSMMIDVKVMYSPVFLSTFRKQLEEKMGRSVPVEDIGNVEREALLSYQAYQRAGARVAVIVVCSFRKELILCDFVENIRELHRDVENRNPKSSGSTTPRINVDLSSMRPLDVFVRDLNLVEWVQQDYRTLVRYLRNHLNFVACPRRLLTSESGRAQVMDTHSYLQEVTKVPLRLDPY